MIFQLDGTPPERWIGRGGPAAWPPRSPDINSLDFFLWGYVKIEVFKSLQHLKGRITQAFAQVTVLMLDKTWKELLRRLKMLTEIIAAAILKFTTELKKKQDLSW